MGQSKAFLRALRKKHGLGEFRKRSAARARSKSSRPKPSYRRTGSRKARRSSQSAIPGVFMTRVALGHPHHFATVPGAIPTTPAKPQKIGLKYVVGTE